MKTGLVLDHISKQVHVDTLESLKMTCTHVFDDVVVQAGLAGLLSCLFIS